MVDYEKVCRDKERKRANYQPTHRETPYEMAFNFLSDLQLRAQIEEEVAYKKGKLAADLSERLMEAI